MRKCSSWSFLIQCKGPEKREEGREARGREQEGERGRKQEREGGRERERQEFIDNQEVTESRERAHARGLVVYICTITMSVRDL